MSEAEQDTARQRPSLLIGGLHLAALWALAFVQPLLELLGRNADFFVARHNTRGDILVFAIGFTLLPPLAMLAIEWVAARIRPALRWGIHLVFVALLAGAFLLPILTDHVFSGPAGVLILLAAMLGVAVAAGYARTRFVPLLLSVLAVAPLVFLANFLLLSQASKLVLPQEEASAASIPIPSKAPIVMIILDEFPATDLLDPGGGIDGSRYPNFRELASESTWFRNATTVADKTPRAVPAILTGTDPGLSSLPIVADHPRNLFTLLAGKYRMDVTESATQLCPAEYCPQNTKAVAAPRKPFRERLDDLVSDLSLVSEHLLLPRGIRRNLAPVNQTFANFRGGGLDEQGDTPTRQTFRPKKTTPGYVGRQEIFTQFVSRITARPRSLYFLHVQLPHFPWQYLPDGRQYGVSPSTDKESYRAGTDNDRWTTNAGLVDGAFQRHLLQVGTTDRLLGGLMAHMKRIGVWDRSIVLVLADHGIAFDPGGLRREISRRNFAQIASVPMFIKAPGQRRGRVKDGPFRTIDVFPTIAKLLDVKLPWDVDGRPDPGSTGEEIEVVDRETGTLTLGFDELLKERDDVTQRRVGLFGTGGGWAPTYRFGPHPELIGRAASSLRKVEPGEARAELDDPDDYAAVGAGGLLPSLVRGTIQNGDPGQEVAIAVNGRIAAVGEAYDLDGTTRFLLMVPPSVLTPGRNQVEIYLVRAEGGRVGLQPAGGTGDANE